MLKCFYILIWIPVFKLCFCQRRMGLGNESIFGKKYLVYFVESPYSKTGDEAWLCAGAIVSPTQILTAAACLVEVNRIYAIAGHKKYVHRRDIDKDKCANTWKKKVVKISVPKEYTTSTAKQIEWMNVDVGVATVQEPYDFDDQSYLTHCSYIPESIKINFDKNNEKQKTRAVALGWGGKKIKSQEVKDGEKIKPKLLQEATTTIIDKTYCAKLKNGSKELVDKYLLCASGNGFLGEDDDETTSNSTVDEQPSTLVLTTDTENISNSREMSSRKSSLLETCQNDHGGPLVTWVGEDEVILGVALNGICNPNFDCVGPRIYVSTAATAKIIECLLETNDKKRKTCNEQVDDKRYQVYDIDIEWPDDLRNNSSLSSLFRRQENEEETLIVRPTKDLRTFDEQEAPQEDLPYNPLYNLQENQQNNPYQLEENPRKNRQRIPQENRGQNPYNEQQQLSQADQTQGTVNDERNNQPRKPVGYTSQQQMESQNQPEVDPFNQPQIESQNQHQIDRFNQAQMDSYNQPPLDSYYNQPPLDPNYNQPPMDSSYKQPPMDSSYKQPPIKSKDPPEMESYNQPQTDSYNQPPDKSNNQKPMDPYNQLQRDISNQPQMASQNQPQRQITSDKSINNNQQIPTSKLPLMESYMPSQEDPYNQPQIGSYKNPLRDLLKLSPFKKTPAKSFYKPQTETFNKTELGSFRPPPSKVESVRLAGYSNKQPQSAHNNKQIESFKPVTAESYNPLDILMAENEPEEEFKPPMEDPYKAPPVEYHKQNDNPYMPQPDKPAQGKPLLSKKNPQYSTRQGQPVGRPFEEPQAPPFDSGRAHSALREGPHIPALEHPQDEPQTFEKMFSQLHAEPETPEPAAPSKEETFDELFRNLHDGDEEPRDKNFETRIDQPIEQEAEQDGVQVRQQMPLEYPDYSLKSKNS